MENELVPNNTTLAGLRGLLREARKNVPLEYAVYVELKMWNYGEINEITETIGVYKSSDGKGTQNFKSIEEAREYIDSWKEEEDANASNK